MVKYDLSFCRINQLAENVYEMTMQEGVVIDEDCAEEAREFWNEVIKEPYGLLVNHKNKFSYSFTGAKLIGNHELERKTAYLTKENQLNSRVSMVMDLQRISVVSKQKKVFHDRSDAIKWLSNECSTYAVQIQ